jgi:hypothetical protein
MGRGPLKGAPIATQRQNHELPTATRIAGIVEAKKHTAGIVKLWMPPGQSRGSPVRTWM